MSTANPSTPIDPLPCIRLWDGFNDSKETQTFIPRKLMVIWQVGAARLTYEHKVLEERGRCYHERRMQETHGAGVRGASWKK